MAFMDYSALNIYSKDKFILRSVIRNMDFPFIRYTGKNYEELINFITSYSPNTIIEPQDIQVGELYTYSRKNFNLKRVPISELRFVIASNPYLVTEKGDCIPLALDRQQAEIYLKENRHNMMFTYKNTIATYKYNPEHSSFVMYDYLHPTGIPFAQLPDSFEWYIGGKDGANRLWRNTSIHYDDVVHSVDARPSLKGLVGRIQALENKVNQKSCIQGQPMLFPQALENRERRNILKKVCLKRDAFISFINALYMIVFEETRSGSPSHTDTLDRYRDEEFAKVLDALYGYYVLGSSTDRVGINSVFQKYLEHNMGPREPRDYAVLQTGLLTDYHSYLNKILGVVAEELIITGIISLDEAGNLYCGKAVLPQKYYAYRGCQCVIAEPSKNLDEKTNTRYPYTSDRLNSVVLKRKGTISKDREGTFYLDKYIFKNAVPEQLGREAQLQLIRPFETPRGIYYGEIIEYVIPDAENVVSADSNVDKRYQYVVPVDVFNEDMMVPDDSMYIANPEPVIKEGNKFQELFLFILKWGKISEKSEQDAMLTFLTGYNTKGKSPSVRWCCDEYMPRVLFYIVKHLFKERHKYDKLKYVVFYSNDSERSHKVNYDILTIYRGNPSSNIEKGVPSNIKNTIKNLFPDLFKK